MFFILKEESPFGTSLVINAWRIRNLELLALLVHIIKINNK
ncbi:hypothetical protein PYCH_15130 [Pyrococcus yayanosii CH1]|uniref:Uncharacterized protein n=1 Tax=Pyrococcus yayanosii (strain CH1 / JCM 16557) TaxID=529709 RepID=F8AGI0_PYRYC|nr:hypothetical protein PYCH_15130 [Pyrococcus yayanosii CH1]